MSNYKLLDHPDLLQLAFYPRPGLSPCPGEAFDVKIEAEDGHFLHYRFYAGDESFPTILYFHGNGEIVSDHDGIAPLYHQQAGANLAVAEFRGYGAADGSPAFMTILADAHLYLKAVRGEIERRGFAPRLFIMGRSLGSVPALELAAAGEERESLPGLIIESGFTCATFLARRFAPATLPPEFATLEEECREKARRITMPALVMHGNRDELVPPVEAEALHALLGSREKELVIIPGAGHNDIMFVGQEEYFAAIRRFISS